MFYHVAALLGIVAIAEVLGLGGIPAKAVETENIVFMVLLLAFFVTAFKGIVRR